jgi:putative salt-induced outer membrane protein YdiY
MRLFSLIISIFFFLALNIIAQINTEQFRKDVDSTGFSGNVGLDFVAMTGNTDFQLFSGNGRLNYNWGKDYTFFVFDAGYGWNNGESFSNQAVFHLRHVITVSNHVQIESFIQYDNNKKRLLLNRELAGLGVRLKLVRLDNFKVRLGAAYMYEIEDYNLPPTSIHPKNISTSRLSTYLSFELKLEHNVSLISVTYFQPGLSDFGDLRSITENAIIVDIGKIVSLNMKFNARYDSRPPDTKKNLDTITRFGISFKF